MPLTGAGPGADRSDAPGFIREIRSLLSLGGPLIFGQLAVMGMSVTDAIIAGHASTPDLAGIALASSIWNPCIVVLITLILSVNSILAAHFGARRMTEFGKDALQGLWLGLLGGIVIGLLVFAALPLLRFVDSEADVAIVTTGYLEAIVWGAPALGIQVALRAVCESTGYTRITLQVYAAALIANAGLDYLFVFGIPGIPAMGGAGCGLASAIVYWLVVVLVLWHVLASSRYRKFGLFRRRLGPDYRRLAALLRLGLPMSMGATAEVCFFSACGVLIAGFGTVALAAHQVALSFSGMMYMIPLGLSSALTIRVAHGLGAGKAGAAALTMRAGFGISASVAGVAALFMLGQAREIAHWYTSDTAVVELAVVLLYFGAAFQFSDALNCCCNGGLRGYRDTFVPMILLLLAFWGIGFTLATSLAYGYLMSYLAGPTGFWMGIVVALTSAYLLLAMRLRWTSKHRVLGVGHA